MDVVIGIILLRGEAAEDSAPGNALGDERSGNCCVGEEAECRRGDGESWG